MSVRPSVPLFVQQRRGAGLLLSAVVQAGDIDRQRLAPSSNGKGKVNVNGL